MHKPDLLAAERCAETLHDHGLMTASTVIRELIDAVMIRDAAIAVLDQRREPENQPYATLSKWPLLFAAAGALALVVMGVMHVLQFRWPL